MVTYKTIPWDDPKLIENYPDIVDRYSKSAAIVIEDSDGIWRFKSNDIVRHIIDNYKILNDLWVAFHDNKYSLEDMEVFYQQMGYSLSGFLDIFYENWHPEE